jgi:hypothetical protein
MSYVNKTKCFISIVFIYLSLHDPSENSEDESARVGLMLLSGVK